MGYEGDLQSILAVGELIGTVVVQTDIAASDEALDAEAKRQAAEHGGTHVVRSAERTSETVEVDESATRRRRVFRAFAQSGLQEGCRDGDMRACRAQLEPATVYKHGERRSVGYGVLIVSPERWSELPPALRPVVSGQSSDSAPSPSTKVEPR
jgi:hypothetical protein